MSQGSLSSSLVNAKFDFTFSPFNHLALRRAEAERRSVT
jgi:hypothetical protein